MATVVVLPRRSGRDGVREIAEYGVTALVCRRVGTGAIWNLLGGLACLRAERRAGQLGLVGCSPVALAGCLAARADSGADSSP